MNGRVRTAAVFGIVGLGAMAWALLGTATPPLVLLIAAAAAPTAVALAVWSRLDSPYPLTAATGGAVIGPVVAIAGHALVAAFAAAFLLGFADSGKALLDALRVEPDLSTLLASPWVLVMLAAFVVAAPIVEEAGKLLGALLGRRTNRGEAFLSGVAAGAAFATVENVIYAVIGAVYGAPWPLILVARAAGAAVHPLATGLATLGWWDARHGGGGKALAKGLFAAAGVHALWNATIVAVTVAETAAHVSGASGQLGTASLGFSAAVGAAMAAALWRLTATVSEDRQAIEGTQYTQARAVAAWIVLAATVLVPAAIIIAVFPSFYLG